MLASQSLDTGDGIFLPTTYQRVEYILSDGSQVIHIPTAFTNGTTVEMIAMQSSDDDNMSRRSLLCPDYGNNPYGYVSCYNFKWELGAALVDANLLSTEKNTIIFSRANDTNYLTIGNYSTSSAFDSGSLGDIYLFGKSGGYSLIKAYLWDMSIYQNDTLVNHLIPCYRKNDNTPGLYDVIEKQFIPVDTSAGTFTVGPDIITRGPYIQFVDPAVEKICATEWGDGIGITKTQATAVTSQQFLGKFAGNTQIVSFEEFQYFTGVDTFYEYDGFYGCSSLVSIKLTNTFRNPGWGSLRCPSLAGTFVLPAGVYGLSRGVMDGTTALTNLVCLAPSADIFFLSSGNGTGILYTKNLNSATRYINANYKHIIIDGNVSFTAIDWLFQGGSVESIRINGNYVATQSGSVFRDTSKPVLFVEMNGTTSAMLMSANNGYHSGAILHLGYNGVAGTAANLYDSNLSQIYVGPGESQAADQAVLDQYLADPDWAQYSSILDIWYNYNGEYKNWPTTPTA